MKHLRQDFGAVLGADRLHQVYDFGLSEEEEAASIRDYRALTEREVAMMIVDEIELKRSGRWGGHPAPPRWIPR